MHQKKRTYKKSLSSGLTIILPAIGIIALSGCVKTLFGSWMDTMPQNLFTVGEVTAAAQNDDTVQPTALILEQEARVTFAAYDQSPVTAEPMSSTGSSTTATLRGCGLYIDGQFYGAFSSGDTLRSILESCKALYATGAEGEKVSFTRDVKLIDGTYPAEDLLTYSGIKSVLESKVFASKDYMVKAGDSLSTMAAYFDMTADELAALNKNMPAELQEGDVLTLLVKEPLLQVKCEKTVTETVSVPFETEIVEDASANGAAQIITPGVNGEKTVTANVITVNGRETSRLVLSEKVITEPVTQQMTAGTDDEITYSASYCGDTGSGVIDEAFIWPLPDNGGTETCQYGEGSHQGVDLAIDAGTEIHAAGSGTVVVAGWYYTYGNCVVIDHGNGIRTLYAHCSSLNVSVGDEVSQGDLIGFVGMTGYATGNHLHFEVHVNNRTRNPFNYIAR